MKKNIREKILLEKHIKNAFTIDFGALYKLKRVQTL